MKIWLSDADIAERRGTSRVSTWRQSRAGLLPPPVKLSPGCTRWATHEVDAVDRARLAGAGDAEIKALVTKLIADRTAAAKAA